jgi:predicted dehydrogenase
MNLTPEEKKIGKDNYYEAIGVSRRDFFKDVIAAGAVSGAGLGAMYFGYDKLTDPVRIGIIGTGDEGNILIGALNPDYVSVVAIADIRPSSIHRALHGDWGGSDAYRTHSLRPGLIEKYGWKSEDEARRNVKIYERYEELLDNSDVEGVIIALPLHLHAAASIQAMLKGKHVLTEKLMAHNVAQCKLMSRIAEQQGLYLSTGHQRHYSVLYDNAVNLMRWGILGEIHHIRAQWHRGNLPGRDSWAQPIPGGEVATIDDDRANPRFKKGEKFDVIQYELDRFVSSLKKETDPAKRTVLESRVAQWTAWTKDAGVPANDFGYIDMTLANGRQRSALEELVRWRLWNRTGGGLMAELGSHQLDAASIFVSAMRQDGKKVHPLSVHAVGGRHTFPLDRDADDHVYCTFEFPGPGYDKDFDVGYRDPFAGVPDPLEGIPSYKHDENKKIVVTYSSINGNGFGGYGEIVMGTKGTLVLEREQDIMVYKGSSTSTSVGVKSDEGGPTLDTQASGGPGAPVAKAADSGPVSRGYTEEIEHWAWCIRNKSPENQTRCHPEVAVGDAVIALTTKVAIDKSNSGQGGYLKFEEAWFDINSDETSDGSSIADEKRALLG